MQDHLDSYDYYLDYSRLFSDGHASDGGEYYPENANKLEIVITILLWRMFSLHTILNTYIKVCCFQTSLVTRLRANRVTCSLILAIL